MKHKVALHGEPSLVIDADGFFVSRDGSLTLFQKSKQEEVTTLQDLFAPTITQSVASFPRGEWKSVYLLEGAESVQ